MQNPALTDRFGRRHTYLRVSVTDRCNFRCVYCMPPEGLDWKPRETILTYEEIARLVRIFVELGVERVRLTGGEPTIRSDFESLVRSLGAIPGLKDLTMTTNGYRLPALAPALVESGMTRINISLDSLEGERFAKLTRGARLDKVLAGIDAARAAGMNPIKINVVMIGGENDDEVLDLVDFFSPHADDTILRFIEYMPFAARRHQSFTARQMRAQIRQRYTLERDESTRGGGPAVGWRVVETGLRLGFISPLSENFCGSCNRLRMMADGHLRTCLSDDGTRSLRDRLRGGDSDADLAAAIREMVMGKREGHGCTVEAGTFEGVMTRIGG